MTMNLGWQWQPNFHDHCEKKNLPINEISFKQVIVPFNLKLVMQAKGKTNIPLLVKIL
jgi:hypothetical protein